MAELPPQVLGPWVLRIYNATLRHKAIHPDLRAVILEEHDEMYALQRKRLEHARAVTDIEAQTLQGMARFRLRIMNLPTTVIQPPLSAADPYRCPVPSPEPNLPHTAAPVKDEDIDDHHPPAVPAPLTLEQLANQGRQRTYLDLNEYFAEHASSSGPSSASLTTPTAATPASTSPVIVEAIPVPTTPQDSVSSRTRSLTTVLPTPQSIAKKPLKNILKDATKKRSRSSMLADDTDDARGSGGSSDNSRKNTKRPRIEDNITPRRQRPRPLRRSYAFRLD
ncbi:hypothetical protein OF83DRAFT_1174537 [Amylostereum chailletii]|nr:hypothetical protein OF83DRAFT_1174537 [Amylostereum chailletii]